MFQLFDKRFALIVLLLFTLFTLAPAFAQDVTPEPGATLLVTLAPTEAAPPVVIPAPAPGNDLLAISGVQLAAYIVLAFAAGGGALAVVYRVLDNKDVQDTAEKLYESWSPDTQETIKDVLAHYREVNQRVMGFLDKVTDGKPNDSKLLTDALPKNLS